MSSNHSEQTAESDILAIEYLWKQMKVTSKAGVTVEQTKKLAKNGLLSVSNILEQAILDTNKKLKKSNKDGEDYTDGSDAKYMTARDRGHGNMPNGTQQLKNAAVLTQKAVRNKKGALRIFITHIDSRNNTVNYRMFLLPYPQWKKRMTKAGIPFFFSAKTGNLTPTAEKRWGEFEVKSFEELCK